MVFRFPTPSVQRLEKLVCGSGEPGKLIFAGSVQSHSCSGILGQLLQVAIHSHEASHKKKLDRKKAGQRQQQLGGEIGGIV